MYTILQHNVWDGVETCILKVKGREFFTKKAAKAYIKHWNAVHGVPSKKGFVTLSYGIDLLEPVTLYSLYPFCTEGEYAEKAWCFYTIE